MKTNNTDSSRNIFDVSHNLLFTTTELSIFNENTGDCNTLESDFFNKHNLIDISNTHL